MPLKHWLGKQKYKYSIENGNVINSIF